MLDLKKLEKEMFEVIGQSVKKMLVLAIALFAWNFATSDAQALDHHNLPLACSSSLSHLVGSSEPADEEFLEYYYTHYLTSFESVDPIGAQSYAHLKQTVLNTRPTHLERLNLTDDEIVAIHHYSYDGFEILNKVLRNSAGRMNFGFTLAGSQQPTLSEVQPIVDLIDSGLNKLPNYEGIVHRVMYSDTPSDILASYKVGQIVKDPAYTSTSYEKEDRTELDKHDKSHWLLVIHSKIGKNIEQFAQIPSEHEVLFRRNTPFRVLSRKINSDGYPEFELEEVTDSSIH